MSRKILVIRHGESVRTMWLLLLGWNMCDDKNPHNTKQQNHRLTKLRCMYVYMETPGVECSQKAIQFR